MVILYTWSLVLYFTHGPCLPSVCYWGSYFGYMACGITDPYSNTLRRQGLNSALSSNPVTLGFWCLQVSSRRRGGLSVSWESDSGSLPWRYETLAPVHAPAGWCHTCSEHLSLTQTQNPDSRQMGLLSNVRLQNGGTWTMLVEHPHESYMKIFIPMLAWGKVWDPFS